MSQVITSDPAECAGRVQRRPSFGSPKSEYLIEGPQRVSRHAGIATALQTGIARRFKRERRRRKIGRAYDMALEIARLVPYGSEVLDIGCGNGFIAHHLGAMLGRVAVGIDLGHSAEAPIDYRQYEGTGFPTPDNSFDAALLCYVLHHAQDVSVVLNEVRRVLREGGVAVIYEDMPHRLWDKGVCWIHNQQWRARTGPCTFRSDSEWRALFDSVGFEIVNTRSLSRWRNLTHPVSRRSYLLRAQVVKSMCQIPDRKGGPVATCELR
jgi:SAM-dependent methyltransferase